MKRVKFFIDMAAFLSIVPILIFAKINFQPGYKSKDCAIHSMVPEAPGAEAGHYEETFRASINSKLITVNF